jgi:hypothetical protein
LFIATVLCVYGTHIWWLPWKRWRQLWRELDHDNPAKRISS